MPRLSRGGFWILLGIFNSPLASSTTEDSPRPGEIEEIIVTATLRDTPLQDAPLSVVALSGETLQADRAWDIVDWSRLVPGLTYSDDDFVGHRMTLRGVGLGLLAEPRPSVAQYLDSTPLTNFAGTGALGSYGGLLVQTVDLARIEVLRGPQGTLFGSGTMGGAVRYITHAPEPGQTYVEGETSYSSTEHGGNGYTLQGVLNAPLIGDVLTMRLVGFTRQDPAFIDNVQLADDDVNDVEFNGGRLALLWQPAEDLAVTLTSHYQDRKSGGLGTADPTVGDYAQVRYTSERDDEQWWLANLDVEYELGWATLTSTTSYLARRPELNGDVTVFSEFILAIGYNLDVFVPTSLYLDVELDDAVQELRLTSSQPGPLSWIVGLYAQRQKHRFTGGWQSPGFDSATGGLAAAWGYPDVPTVDRASTRLDQRAIYGEVTYVLSERWAIDVGTRYYNYDLRHSQSTDGFLSFGYSTLRAKSNENGWSPKATLSYRDDADRLIYATIATGARPGGPNQFSEEIVNLCRADLAAAGYAGAPPPFESDSLTSYEIGAKTTWLQQSLAVNTSVYHIDWDDAQTFRNLNCGYGLAENAAGVDVDGAELELAWQRDGLQLSLGMAYIDSRLSNDEPRLVGESGESVPVVPEFTLTATAAQEWGELLRPFWRATYQYAESTWSDFNEASRTRIPSHSVVDLFGGVRYRHWSFELFAQNVFDERVVLGHMNFAPVGNWDIVGRPRTVGLSVRFVH